MGVLEKTDIIFRAGIEPRFYRHPAGNLVTKPTKLSMPFTFITPSFFTKYQQA
jgi:hypothetical protein